MPAERYGGPIDPYSPWDLYDVLEGNLPHPRENEPSSTEFYGFHIKHQGSDSFEVHYDGHLGCVLAFHADDYDDVLELVDDLVDLVIRQHEFEYQGDTDGLVEWAGKMVTSDEERAAENPEHYILVPEDTPPA